MAFLLGRHFVDALIRASPEEPETAFVNQLSLKDPRINEIRLTILILAHLRQDPMESKPAFIIIPRRKKRSLFSDLSFVVATMFIPAVLKAGRLARPATRLSVRMSE